MTPRSDELRQWTTRVSSAGWHWYVKYVSANDTYAKANVHQAGPYVGKDLLRLAFPNLLARAQSDRNPDLHLPISVVSSSTPQRTVRLVWYNSAQVERRSGGRNEARLTGWGGREHPIVAEDATGSLAVFAFFQPSSSQDAVGCEVWISETAEEEDEILGLVGALEPGKGILYSPDGVAAEVKASASSCALRADEIRPEWANEMPSGEAIVDMVLARLRSSSGLLADERLMKRRACEFELFRSLEDHIVGPRVQAGFQGVDEFIRVAHSVTNRRKSRAGRSLELQMRVILGEERIPFSWTPATEEKRTPDFIFPSIACYHDGTWPQDKLRMLAAKTTCKDRWRQILNEAGRIPNKHLLTVQEGVSVSQYREMKAEGVTLVVPKSLHRHFPVLVQTELLTVAEFLSTVGSLND